MVSDSTLQSTIATIIPATIPAAIPSVRIIGTAAAELATVTADTEVEVEVVVAIRELVDMLVMPDVVVVTDAGRVEVDVELLTAIEVVVEEATTVLTSVLRETDVDGSCGLAETENAKKSRVIGTNKMVNFIMV